MTQPLRTGEGLEWSVVDDFKFLLIQGRWSSRYKMSSCAHFCMHTRTRTCTAKRISFCNQPHIIVHKSQNTHAHIAHIHQQLQVVMSVGVGVGMGTALGFLRIVMGWPLLPMLLVGYAIALVLTIPSNEVYVCVAWDSAGVTTGPVTVPLVISLGLGLGKALEVPDGRFRRRISACLIVLAHACRTDGLGHALSSHASSVLV